MDKEGPVTYTGVHVYRANHAYVSCVDDSLAAQNVDHAIIRRHLDDAWGQRPLGNAVRGMCASERKGRHTLIALGTDGTVIELLFPDEREETIDDSDAGPSDLVTMRALKRIDGDLYAAGMARHVYRRVREDQWAAIDQNVFVARNVRKQPVGFNAICGHGKRDIYAAGMQGEIWSFDGTQWTQESSPTNVVLNAATLLGRTEVCIVGMAGVVVCGKRVVGASWKTRTRSATSGAPRRFASGSTCPATKGFSC
jgi:hypothetical protein